MPVVEVHYLVLGPITWTSVLFFGLLSELGASARETLTSVQVSFASVFTEQRGSSLQCMSRQCMLHRRLENSCQQLDVHIASVAFFAQAKKWFEVGIVTTVQGVKVKVPKGPLFEDCGFCCESWPAL